MTYKQQQTTQNSFRREFSKDVETTELIWHRDKKDRKMNIIEGVGWMIQFDNAIPVELTKGKEIRVIGTPENPLFIGKDIAEILGYTDTSQSIREHVDEEDKTTWIQDQKNGVSLKD